MAEATREHVRLSPARAPEQRVAIAHAAHPEALPFARLDDCTGDLLG
jgi:hypothetical protein